MKKLLFILIFGCFINIFGCEEAKRPQHIYNIGDMVYTMVGDKKGQVVDIICWPGAPYCSYNVRVKPSGYGSVKSFTEFELRSSNNEQEK